MRAFDRDLIRGGHYGQRACEPHSKAEHMAAPTNAALVRKALPTRSRPHMTQLGRRPRRIFATLQLLPFTRAAILATPSCAQASSLSPPGDPPTPSPATISLPRLIATPPGRAKISGRLKSAELAPAGFLLMVSA